MRPRVNPTIFDKLVSDTEIPGLHDDSPATEVTRDTLKRFSVARVERFNEEALRGTIIRELGWLFNTTNLDSVMSLEHFPNVRSSVLNYGVPAMSGRSVTSRSIQQRAREIRTAIMTYEPRFDCDSLLVEASDESERENSITFVISGDVTSAVNALPIQLKTDVEIDSAAVTVRE